MVAAAGQGDFLAEMRTRRFDTLTYARSGTEAEDITLFDRKRHHNIALYASKRQAGERAAASTTRTISSTTTSSTTTSTSPSTPDRQWIDGRAQHAAQSARRPRSAR